ncbi:neuronal PAS domain-containing protein 4-like [Conger conger]|uniref:neuronal PAS domain-containing protein 4-like n=1 Tax=Conger conger TaxID=82655 RepID=UPI002A598F0F|nr:neuronal PAS domain-containing protein 4-like [Conger conger]
MTVCCDSSPASGKGGSSPCSSPRATDASVNRRKVPCKRYRSTKGASKARRDHINSEIRSMRHLLPIGREDQERLSYLHSMSAICTYVRKSLFFQGLQPEEGESSSGLYAGFLQALPGFIMAMTSEGKLIYVSENVFEYLGLSMVDLLQGDSFYSMVERKEVNMVKSQLEDRSAEAVEKAFVCRMHASKAFRVRQGGSCTVLVRGRFQPPPPSSAGRPELDGAFVALCTPTVNRLKDDDLRELGQTFRTTHRLDMAVAHACESTPFYLGYSSEDMIGRSWYNLLHPADLNLGIEAHKVLLQVDDGTPVEMVLRLQCRDLSWKRLYVRAAKDSGKQTVICTNHIISETEAEFLVQKIYTDIHGLSGFTQLQNCPQRPAMPHVCPCQGNGTVAGLKRPRLPSSPSEQPQNKTSRLEDPGESDSVPTSRACAGGSSPDDHQMATSPTSSHSPAPSHSPPAQEDEAESDFLLDICYYTEDLLSLPVYLPFQDSRCGSSGPLPASDALQPIAGHGFPPSDVGGTSPSPSPSYEFPSCPADARLVPDCLPTPDAASDGLSDCSFHPEPLLQPADEAGSSYFIPLPDPATPMTSDLSPTPGAVSGSVAFPYSEKERREISVLARQISSLASSFDTYRSAGQARSLGNGYKKAPADRGGCGRASDLTAPGAGAAGRMFSWSQSTLHPVKPELVLDEGVIDSILKDLERVPGGDALPCSRPVSSCGPGVGVGPRSGQQTLGAADVLSFAALVEDLSREQPPGGATAMDTHILPPGLRENIELNQLNHFLRRDLQHGTSTVRYAQV